MGGGAIQNFAAKRRILLLCLAIRCAPQNRSIGAVTDRCSVRCILIHHVRSAEDDSKPAAPGGAKPAEELTPEEIARREAKKKAKEEEKVHGAS